VKGDICLVSDVRDVCNAATDCKSVKSGRTLLWWAMNEREAEVWRRKRRAGPKAVP
jgi:hypothetical protein